VCIIIIINIIIYFLMMIHDDSSITSFKSEREKGYLREHSLKAVTFRRSIIRYATCQSRPSGCPEEDSIDVKDPKGIQENKNLELIFKNQNPLFIQFMSLQYLLQHHIFLLGGGVLLRCINFIRYHEKMYFL
jgi:hypothetical protein